MKKVFIIGLDGGPYKEIKEWIEKDELPFLSKMAKEGTFGRLKSIIPPFTMLAWPVIFTGKNPAKIGPFLYKSKKKGFDPEFFSESQFINSTDILTWTIWKWASHFGRKVGVINIPMTYPPHKVNGFLVSGSNTPKGAESFTYPENVKNDLKDYIINLEFSGGIGKIDKSLNKDELRKDFENLVDNRREATLRLLKKYNPDVFMINFKEIDDFMHYFWNNKEKTLDFLRRNDETIKAIYEQQKPDYVMVVSDHGFSKAPSKYFYINQYLLDRGYLKRSGNVSGKFFNVIYRVGIAIVKKFSFVRNLFSERVKLRVVRGSVKEQIDWENTHAYAHWYAGLYLNPKFYPDEESKKKGAEELKKVLLEAKDPDTGADMILTAKTKWELFEGDFFDEMPEVVYTSTEDYRLNTNLPGKLVDERLDRPSLVGHHTSALDGIIFAMGRGIKEGSHIEAKIQDVFTIACVLGGLPIPEDSDGRVPEEILEESYFNIEFNDLKYTEKSKDSFFLSEEEDQAVKEHLKDLGYL